jgi:ATP-binding cassette subfamily B protein
LASVIDKPYDLKQAVSPNRLIGLLRLLTGFRLRYLAAILTLGIGATAKTVSFLLLAYLVDEVLLQQNVGPALLLIGLSFVGLALIEGGFTFLSGKLAAQTAEGVARRMRNYLFDHIQRLTFTYHDRMQTGELIQRVTSDLDAVRRFFAEQAIGLGRIMLLFSVNLIALMALNWQLALVSIIAVPLIAALSVYFFRKISKIYEEYQEQDAKLSTTLQENLTGVRVVKAFARQDYERSKFEGDNWQRFLRGRSFMRMHSFYWPLTDIIAGGQMLAGYVVGALMVIDGTITLGTYLAYIGMVIWIIEPMRGLGRVIVHTSTGLVSYERIATLLREDRELLDDGARTPEGDVRGEIVFDNVSFEYLTGGEVLRNINFRANPGQSVALLGSTGSGKTTLMNLLPRFYDYTGGTITLDGVDIKDISRSFLRAQIGIVEQEPFLFSRSIRENISYGVGREVTDAEVEAAARAAAIHDVIESFPEGYGTLVGEKGVTLSGGQKQRVAIARTLLKDPRILILDDSTSSVDTETEADIREALRRLMENRTTFIIAHRIQSVMEADLILVLDKGDIVQRGTHDTLVNTPGIYQQIYDLQARIELELEKEIASV